MISERDKRKLLIAGWAGRLTGEELTYIEAALLASEALHNTLYGTIFQIGLFTKENLKIGIRL